MIPESTETHNINNVIGGYKATINNPNVSDEAKEHAKEMLEKLQDKSNESQPTLENDATDDNESQE